MIGLTVLLAFGLAQSAAPAQAERGKALFFGAGRCSACHSIKGEGTAVGPDLTRLARIPPRAIATAVLATRTQYVQAVKLKSGETFPGMKVSESADATVFYNVSKDPPEQRKLSPSDIDSVSDNSTWKHPPQSAGLKSEQLADIIGYLRYAAYGERKPVDPSDVE